MEEPNGFQTPSIPTPVCPYSYSMVPGFPDYEDELSLVGVWRVLAHQWKVILTPAIFAVIAAAGYLLTATPRYEADVVLLPPEAHQVEALNTPGIHETSPDKVYAVLLRNLRSNSLRRQFFDENGLFYALGGDRSDNEGSVFEKSFSNRLKVVEGTREQKDRVSVTLEGTSPDHIAKWLNEFVGFAASTTVTEITGGVATKIGNEQDRLRRHIEIDRELARQRRLDRIAVLEEKLSIIRHGRSRQDRITVLDEQIAIARELNIIDRNESLARALKEQSVSVSVTTASEPLYLRGVTALVAEKEALENREDEDPFLPGLRETIAEMQALETRTNDDPFISGIRDKEEQLAKLEVGLVQLRASAARATPVRIDRKAIAPEAPARPRKTRILPISLVAGLLLGVFAAFQVNALKHQKA